MDNERLGKGDGLARQDSDICCVCVSQAQEKYERELMSHAEAVDSLTKAKQEVRSTVWGTLGKFRGVKETCLAVGICDENI